MITTQLIFNQLPNGAITFEVRPNQENATELEMKFASVIELGISTAANHLLENNNNSQMVAGDGIEDHIKAMLQKADF